MKDLIKTISLACFAFTCSLAFAQPAQYSTINAHSHNDYLNNEPFSRAFRNGFGSIEADIFPVNGTLVVAHSKKEIQPSLTLQKLYLDPLLKELETNHSVHLKLLVDIKENYKESLSILLQELESLQKYLSTPLESKPLTILISGNRPPPGEYENYPGYIFFDGDQQQHHEPAAWVRVGLVSLPFSKISTWKGQDALKQKDKKILKRIIDSVHHAGKMIRFWAAPDNPVSWKAQMKLGVDLIGTDQIDALGNFLRTRKRKQNL